MCLRSITRVVLNACSIRLFGSIVVLFALCTSHSAHAAESSSTKLAYKLVTRFWNDVKHQNVKAYSRLLTPNFQGLNVSGAYTRSDQITGLKNLTVTSFKIKKLVAARHENTLVVSYDFIAHGHGIVSGPSIDIWYKNARNKWKLVSHSYVPFQ